MTTHNYPRHLSSVVPGLTKDVFGRKSMLFGKMLANWGEVAGAEMAQRTVPMDLKFNSKTKKTAKDAGQAVLHLAVQSAYALEFDYQKALLIERLNMFFGYPAIKDIKVIQHSEVMSRKTARKPASRPVSKEAEENIAAAVAGIQENDLQTALKNLGKAIASRNTGAKE